MITSPPISVAALCAKLGAPVPEGLGDVLLTDITSLDSAEAHHVSYIQKEKFLAAAKESRATLLLAPASLPVDRPGVVPLRDVMGGVLTVLEYFHPPRASQAHVHPTAVVDATVRLGNDVYVGPHVVLEEGVVIGDGTRIEALSFVGEHTRIGAHCRIGPRVVIMDECHLGNRVQLHPGVVIGADGFRYEAARGRLCKVPQVGRVVLEDDVEIGANSTVDRASFTETRLGARTKLDNLVHVGHNVQIGSDCILVAQVGIAGSTKIGRGVMIGGQTGVKDHLTIGDRAKIAGHSAVQNDVPPGAELVGFPAIPVKHWARFTQFYKRFHQHWEKLGPLVKEKELQ